MKLKNFLTRILATLALLGLVMTLYLLFARPYQLSWGVSEAEIDRAMPGDALEPNPTFLSTRAITIQGTPEEIWPWLLQMGYGRAGYYGYDLIENAGSPRGLLSAEAILPEFQNFQPGDVVPISGVASMAFGEIQPNSHLIWTGTSGEHPGGFTWALYPIDDAQTRLVIRIRWRHHWTQPDVLPLDLFTEFADHLAVRKILHGVKDRVEGRPAQPMALQNLEIAVYVLTALAYAVALLLTLLRPFTWKRWLAGLAVGLVWLIVWYAPIF